MRWHISIWATRRSLSQQPPQKEEHEADKFASDWLLDGVTDAAVMQKRALGIAVANIVLILVDLAMGRPRAATHPKSHERLQRNLRSDRIPDDSLVHAFAMVLLQMHLTVFGVNHTLDLEGAFACLVEDMCFDLQRQG
jgi:Peptidase U49